MTSGVIYIIPNMKVVLDKLEQLVADATAANGPKS